MRPYMIHVSNCHTSLGSSVRQLQTLVLTYGIPLSNKILGLLMSTDVNLGLAAALADYKIDPAAVV